MKPTEQLIINWLLSVNKDTTWLADKLSLNKKILESRMRNGIYNVKDITKLKELGCPIKF